MIGSCIKLCYQLNIFLIIILFLILVLHLFPNDEVAFKTKIVCHVNRGMFAEALSLINDTSKLSG